MGLVIYLSLLTKLAKKLTSNLRQDFDLTKVWAFDPMKTRVLVPYLLISISISNNSILYVYPLIRTRARARRKSA